MENILENNSIIDALLHHLLLRCRQNVFICNHTKYPELRLGDLPFKLPCGLTGG